MVDTRFLDELASSTPTPGGGGAAAYCGALAAALSSMVGNLTVGKSRYAEVEDEVREVLGELESVRARLIELIAEDAEAFAPVAAAYKMPKDTPEEAAAKDAALQAALAGACEVPLEIMRQCSLVVDACALMAKKGSRMAVSDAGASAVLARAAMQAASLNVVINVKSMADAEQAAAYEAEMSSMLQSCGAKADEVYEYTLSIL